MKKETAEQADADVLAPPPIDLLPWHASVIFGVLLVIEDPNYEFSQTWVTLGLIAFLASALTGVGFLGPETGRLAKLAEERGPEDPELQRRIARVFLISRIELVILILIILDMVLKPGFP